MIQPWSRFRVRILVPFLLLTAALVSVVALVAVATLQALFTDRANQSVVQLLGACRG